MGLSYYIARHRHRLVSRVSECDMEVESRRQQRLLEDELGRPRIAVHDDSIASAEEAFKRAIFEVFESARRTLEQQDMLSYCATFDERAPPLMLAESLTVAECVEFLRAFSVSSAPVLTADTKKFVGWFSTVDVLHLLLSAIQRRKPPSAKIASETAALSGHPHLHSAWGVLRKAIRTVTSSERLSGASIEEREVVLDNLRREWLDAINKDDIAFAIAETLVMTLHEARHTTHSEEDGRMVSRIAASDATLLDCVRSGFLRHIVSAGDSISPRQAHVCHRVCTYELKPDNTDFGTEKMIIRSLVSQSDIVQFLHNNSESFDDKLKRMNLSSLGLGSRKVHRVFPDSDVLSCFPQTRLLDAFGMMHVSGRSCVAVVDEPRGKLMEVLSVSDVSDAIFDADALAGTVEDYLKDHRTSRIPLAVLHEDADFMDVLAALTKNAIHHVFVVDLEGSPLRVITPTDIISRISLPSARKLGWRFDSYDVHPDTFEQCGQSTRNFALGGQK